MVRRQSRHDPVTARAPCRCHRPPALHGDLLRCVFSYLSLPSGAGSRIPRPGRFAFIRGNGVPEPSKPPLKSRFTCRRMAAPTATLRMESEIGHTFFLFPTGFRSKIRTQAGLHRTFPLLFQVFPHYTAEGRRLSNGSGGRKNRARSGRTWQFPRRHGIMGGNPAGLHEILP